MGGGGAIALSLLFFLAIPIGLACGGGDSPATPTSTSTSSSPSPTPTVVPSSPTQTTSPPIRTEPPGRDLLDLAHRFRNVPADASPLARLIPYDHQVGDSEEFTLIDLEAPRALEISATLRLITDHAYFFVEEGVSVSTSTLEGIGADFEDRVYPLITAAFGTEWSPGVDSDPRITILHANLTGVGGYVSLSDEFPAAVVPRSNEREMLYLDSTFVSSQLAVYSAIAAHELQHLIHANADPDEEAWVNEGLSQVASELLAIEPGANTSRLQSFLVSPDTQLNHWPADGDTGIRYAASQLFFRYLLDRFGGRENASQLLSIQEDGIAGVEAYLAPFEGAFLDVFADWLVANYLDEEDGPYSHADVNARVTTVTTIQRPGSGNGSVHQYAADYLEVEAPEGEATFTFDGADQVSIGVPPRDGPFWWSNRGDGIDSRLTREFDLRGLERATLRFWTWFDIEGSWDYAYVAVSTNGGQTWQALSGRHTTEDDPVGAAYGPGYTGASGGEDPGWLQEEIDLTPFAGQKVLLRFEYVTDDAANLTGFAVDDIEIPEIGFRDPADSAEGWTAEGFHRIEGPLAQRFLLMLIQPGDQPIVTRVPLDTANRAEISITGPVTIVVAAVTEGTTETSPYSWSLSTPASP